MSGQFQTKIIFLKWFLNKKQMVFDISFENPKGNFRFPENEFWNLPLKIAFLPAAGDCRDLSGQNGCNVDSLGVFGRFRGLPTAFTGNLDPGMRINKNYRLHFN